MARRRKRDPNVPWYQRYLIAAIRKVWRYSPARQMARKLAEHPTKIDKKTGKKYQRCTADGLYHKREDTQVDHINPAVAVTGFQDWNTYIERTLAVTVDDLQILCKSCHKEKSKKENEERRKHRE